MYGLLKLDKRISALEAGGGGGGGGDAASMTLKYYTAQNSGSYTVDENGVYMIICATSYGSTHTVTIPQGATIIDEQEDYDFAYANGRGIEVKIVRLSAGDVVSIEQTWETWIGRAFAIVKLNNITIDQNESFDAVDDGTKTVTVTAGTKRLVLGVAIGSSVRNDSNISESEIFLGGAWGNGALVALYVTDSAGTFSFYGYDGGLASIGVWDVT